MRTSIKKAAAIAALLGLLGGAVFVGRHVPALAYWYRDRQEFKTEGELRLNPTLHLPLTLPTRGQYGLVDAFPRFTFDSPTEVAFMGGRTFVLERAGRLWTFPSGDANATKELVVDFSAEVGTVADEEGAVGLAIHPSHGTDGPFANRVFVYYTAHEGKSRFDRLVRYDLDRSLKPVESHRLLDQQDENGDHNGGTLLFGADGYLYVSVGDEGNCTCGNHQRIDKDLFSGILRIDVDGTRPGDTHPIRKQPQSGRTRDYSIPNDNPFVGVPGALEEFWSIGLRNPFRISFDPATGRLFGGDVGRAAIESVFEAKKGSNHRWSLFEGDREHRFTDAPTIPEMPGVPTPPLFAYPHANMNLAVIGGVVYHGTRFPELVGKYIYGDNVSGRIWALDLNSKDNREILTIPARADQGLTAIVPDPTGELLLVTMGSKDSPGSNIFHLASRQDAANKEEQGLPLLLSHTGFFTDLEHLVPTDAHKYTINLPMWPGRKDVESLRWVIKVAGDPSPVFKPTGEWLVPGGLIFVKHLRAGGRNVETQILVMSDPKAGYGMSYRWREDGTDAELVTHGEDVEIGGARWHFGTSDECSMCHNDNTGIVLAFSSRQLNVDGQLLRLRGEGLFQSRATLTRRYWGVRQPIKAYNELLEIEGKLGEEPLVNSSVLDSTERLSSLASKATPEEKVRSYLDVNCSTCHRPGGLGGDNYDARYQVLMADKGLQHDARRPIGDARRLIVPGNPDKSLIFARMRSQEVGVHMPPFGLPSPDVDALAVLAKWIRSQQ